MPLPHHERERETMMSTSTPMQLKAFIFQEDLYTRAIPGKNLFKSTMVHEVVNRGDIFAIRVKDQCLTIIPGSAVVTHLTLDISDTQPQGELFP